MRSSWPGYSSSSSAAHTDNAPEAIAGQNVQNGDKGLPALLGRPCEPRNHAVFFRQCGAGPILCIRFGHDPAHFLRGWTGRAALLRDVAWAERSPGRGHSTSTGAVHAAGDRMAVPERVPRSRLEWLAPGRAECPRPDILVATTHPAATPGGPYVRAATPAGSCARPRRRAAFQDTAWKGTLKTVVQRPSPWLTLRLPPRASTRRRVLSMPGCGGHGSDEAGEFHCPCGAKKNPIWLVSCQMRVDVEMDALADTT